MNPIKIGEYARALEIGERYGKIILVRYMGWTEEMAERVIKTLVYQYPSHDFIIDYEELQNMELPAELVDDETAVLLFDLREKLLKTKKSYIELIEQPALPTPPQDSIPVKEGAQMKNNDKLQQQTKKEVLLPNEKLGKN